MAQQNLKIIEADFLTINDDLIVSGDTVQNGDLCVIGELQVDKITGKGDNDTFVNNVLIGNRDYSTFIPLNADNSISISSSINNVTNSSIGFYNQSANPNLEINSFDQNSASILFNAYHSDGGTVDKSSDGINASFKITGNGEDLFLLGDTKAINVDLDYNNHMTINNANRTINMEQIFNLVRSADCRLRLGDSSAPINTQDVFLTMDAKRDVTLYLSADRDGLSANDENMIIMDRHVEDVDCRLIIPTTNNFVFQCSRATVNPTNPDMIFQTSGTFVKNNNPQVPNTTGGHTESLRLLGLNGHVQIGNILEVDQIIEKTLNNGILLNDKVSINNSISPVSVDLNIAKSDSSIINLEADTGGLGGARSPSMNFISMGRTELYNFGMSSLGQFIISGFSSDLIFRIGSGTLGVFNSGESPVVTLNPTEAMRILESNSHVQIAVNLQTDSITELSLNNGLDIELVHIQDGLPTVVGVEFVSQLSNPFQTTAADTLWLDVNNSDRPTLGSNVLLQSTSANLIDNRVCRYDSTNGFVQNSLLTVDDSGNLSGVNNITQNGTLFVDTILEKTLTNGVSIEMISLEDGLIISDGLQFNALAANPGAAGLTLWADTNNSNRLEYGARTIILMDNPTTDNLMVKTDTTLGRIQETGISIDDSDNLTAVNSITFNLGSSALNRYEEATHNSSFSGIWAVAQNVTLTFTRVGRKVTMNIQTVLAASNTASFISLDNAFPSQFRPGTTFYQPVIILDDATQQLGLCLVGSTGILQIYVDPAQNNFSGTSASGNSGIFECYISWSV